MIILRHDIEVFKGCKMPEISKLQPLKLLILNRVRHYFQRRRDGISIEFRNLVLNSLCFNMMTFECIKQDKCKQRDWNKEPY